MSNPLTGDFDAVLQVSGGTINRLLASLHQNAFANLNLPSFPHSAQMRIGDPHAFDGVRGRVHAQISVPQVELIHGATDRFILEVGVRAWFKPDPGTSPLPAFIHGTVRAEYRIQDIDSACVGFPKPAEYLWLRVVKDSVRFQGTAVEDRSGLTSVVSPETEAANLAKITKQIAVQLATRFEATPHPVSNRFRRGSLRTLNAPIGGSAVATALSLNGGDPVGDIASVNTLLLDGADLAIGVSVGFLMSFVTRAIDPIKDIKKTVNVHVSGPFGDFDTVYSGSFNPPKVEWQPQGTYAVFNIKASGSLTTDSELPNASIDVEQNIHLNFDPDAGLWLSPGSRSVKLKVNVSGVEDLMKGINSQIADTVKNFVESACTAAQPALTALSTRTDELSKQLTSLDDRALVGLDQAVFSRDGLIFRGWVALSSRHRPVVQNEKTPEADGHSALQSWIPGGRIETFAWSWIWSGSGDPGKSTQDDRFVLRRPTGKSSRWGTSLGLTLPLPGLDGYGFICLTIKGVQVDPVNGHFVPVESTRVCTRYGLLVSDTVKKDKRLLVRDMPALSKEVLFPELALVSLEAGPNVDGKANTLLLYVDEAWDRETASTLERGLQACGRYDAGLHVLVLFKEGVLAAKGPGLMRQVEGFAQKIGIAVLVNEDVRGSWAQTFELRSGEPSWRLLSPDGTVTWRHQGHLASDSLTEALDKNLVRSPDPVPTVFRSNSELDQPVTAIGVDPGFFEEVSHCPPIPFKRLGRGGAVVTFVQKDSASSNAQLRKLSDQYGQADKDGPLVVVVVDGVNAKEAEALKKEMGLDFVAFPDPTGAITDQFGVRIWPTTMTLNRLGTISEIEEGIAPKLDDAGAPTYGAEY